MLKQSTHLGVLYFSNFFHFYSVFQKSCLTQLIWNEKYPKQLKRLKSQELSLTISAPSKSQKRCQSNALRKKWTNCLRHLITLILLHCSCIFIFQFHFSAFFVYIFTSTLLFGFFFLHIVISKTASFVSGMRFFTH